jgi:hypothetical protein
MDLNATINRSAKALDDDMNMNFPRDSQLSSGSIDSTLNITEIRFERLRDLRVAITTVNTLRIEGLETVNFAVLLRNGRKTVEKARRSLALIQSDYRWKFSRKFRKPEGRNTPP